MADDDTFWCETCRRPVERGEGHEGRHHPSPGYAAVAAHRYVHWMDRYRTRIVTGHSDFTAVAGLIYAVAGVIGHLLLKAVRAVIGLVRRLVARWDR